MDVLNHLTIKDELERVLTSRCFRSRKTLCLLLRYLTEQALLGKADQLSQYTIAVQALGKTKDFNATIDPVVRIQIGRLRQQLDEYYKTEGKFNPLRITLPSRSYQLVITLAAVQLTALPLVTNAGLHVTPPQSLSQGPNIICIPRNFTQDDEGNWLFICGLTRDYVTALTRFIYCQVTFAEELQWRNAAHQVTNWQQYNADFALFFDLYQQHNAYELKCSLVQRTTQQIIWAHHFPLGEHYPEKAISEKIFKRIAHDTIGIEKGLALSYWARQLLDSDKPIASHHQLMVDVR